MRKGTSARDRSCRSGTLHRNFHLLRMTRNAYPSIPTPIAGNLSTRPLNPIVPCSDWMTISHLSWKANPYLFTKHIQPIPFHLPRQLPVTQDSNHRHHTPLTQLPSSISSLATIMPSVQNRSPHYLHHIDPINEQHPSTARSEILDQLPSRPHSIGRTLFPSFGHQSRSRA